MRSGCCMGQTKWLLRTITGFTIYKSQKEKVVHFFVKRFSHAWSWKFSPNSVSVFEASSYLLAIALEISSVGSSSFQIKPCGPVICWHGSRSYGYIFLAQYSFRYFVNRQSYQSGTHSSACFCFNGMNGYN